MASDLDYQALFAKSVATSPRAAAGQLYPYDFAVGHPAAEPRLRSPAKPRTRRKTADAKQQAEAPAHRFVRPPDKPVVVINRH